MTAPGASPNAAAGPGVSPFVFTTRYFALTPVPRTETIRVDRGSDTATCTVGIQGPGTIADTQGPTIEQFSHSPAQPTTSDAVILTAVASDSSGMSEIAILYEGTPNTCINLTSCARVLNPQTLGVHTYSVTVKDASPARNVSTASGSFTVIAAQVMTPPQITRAPMGTQVGLNNQAYFWIEATGMGLHYEWQSDLGSPDSFQRIPDAPDIASYTTPRVTAAYDDAQFRCVVSNTAGSVTSAAARLTVPLPPQITQQPTNQTATVGQSVTFTAAASSNTTSYQWEKLGGMSRSTAGPSLTINPVSLADAGSYRLRAGNNAGFAYSNWVTLTVTP